MNLSDSQQTTRQTLHARRICVIIPTFNNVGTIARVVSDVQKWCDDVIVVNDGSNDGTEIILQSCTDITLVSYPSNRGKGYALKQGIRKALAMGFAYAITMDADGQHFASDIPLLLKANQEHPGSLIVGSRQMSHVKRSRGSVFANHFSNFWFFVQTLHPLPDTQTGFRLYPLKKLRGYSLLTSRFEAELELLVFPAWHGVPIVPVSVHVYYPPKEQRVSHFRPAADFARISVLNTVLCLLAIVYGLPLFIWRTLGTVARNLFAFCFVFFAMLFYATPYTWLYIKCGKMTEHKKWHLHLFIFNVAKFIMQRMGVPGVKFETHTSDQVNFDRPSLIICNHQSQLDLLSLLTLTPKIVFLTNDWVWHNPLYGNLIRHAEYYPASMGIDVLLPRFQSLVERGYSIAIFPEGTRSQDCQVAPFHRGAAYIAQKLGLGITPVCLYGTGKVLRKKSWHLRRGTIRMDVAAPLTRQQLDAMGTVKQQTSALHHRYQQWYADLCNQMEQDA